VGKRSLKFALWTFWPGKNRSRARGVRGSPTTPPNFHPTDIYGN